MKAPVSPGFQRIVLSAAVIAVLAVSSALTAACSSRSARPAQRPPGSPDNGVLVYWRSGSLFALDLASWTEARVATVPRPFAMATAGDGQHIAVLTEGGSSQTRRLTLVDRTSSSSRGVPCAPDAGALQWSPGGRFLAVESGLADARKVAIYETEDWEPLAEVDQTDGAFSLDGRYYAYAFEAAPGPPSVGPTLPGIGLIDLNATPPRNEGALKGRTGESYTVRGWVFEGLLYERTSGPTAQGIEYGLVTPNGGVTPLRPKDPWLQAMTQAEAGEKVAARFPDAGPQLDLSKDSHWLLFDRPVDGANWVIAWDVKTSDDPVALAPGRVAAWLTDPRVVPEPESFPYYVRKLDERLEVFSSRDIGGGRKLLEVTGKWPAPDDSQRIFYYWIYDDSSGLYYLILGEGDNARFVRQDGNKLVFWTYGMFGRPGRSFPGEAVYGLDKKAMEDRTLFLPVGQTVETGSERVWSLEIAGVTCSDGVFTFDLRPVKGAVVAGGWSPPWSVSSYDEGAKEFTLTMRRMALGPGLRANEPMCLGTGDGFVESVTFIPDGETLKAVFKLNAPAVWQPGPIRDAVTDHSGSHDERAFWAVTFKTAP